MKARSPSPTYRVAMFRPSELLEFLEEIGRKPRKGLSQNFLIDGNILQKILRLADIQPGDHVLEIGPGPGALTEQLLKSGAHVIAVERDDVYATHLPRLESDGRLKVFCDDILSFDLSAHIQPNTKVVANLPYHLTAPILALIAPRHDLFHSYTVMVQDEVGRRMCAHAGGKDFSSLSLFLQCYGDPKYGFKVSRRSFFPSPKVESAVVHSPLKTPPLSNMEPFHNFVRLVFQQRRKTVRAILKKQYPNIEELLASQNLPPSCRPSELSLEQFLNLFLKI